MSWRRKSIKKETGDEGGNCWMRILWADGLLQNLRDLEKQTLTPILVQTRNGHHEGNKEGRHKGRQEG
jgi:hypothetical protein